MIHPTARIEDDVSIGRGTRIWDHVHVRTGAAIGEDCIVGEKTYVAVGVRIGSRVKINAFVYICTGVTIEDGVMVSAGTIFTNDRTPRATTPDLQQLRGSEPDDHTRATRVCEGATLGAGSIIGCDLAIGRFAMVGMGSVVTRDVPDFHLVTGNPARSVGCVCRCGRVLVRFDADTPLTKSVACADCSRGYEIDGDLVTEREPDPRGPLIVGSQRGMEHWGVVGGGMLGMTLAHRLREQGRRVTLLEASPSLGGLASAWTVGEVAWDRHYHVILLSDTRLRGLLAEIGLEDELCWSETKTGFFVDGRLHSMSNLVEFLRFPPLTLIEKLRLGGTIFYASRIRNWKALEGQPVAAWLERWSGRGTCEKIWLPLLRAKLGECYTRTSAAFIWATIARMYAARRTGLKKEMFGYVRGGYARILERFGERLLDAGVAIELDAPVQRIDLESDGGFRVAYGEDREARFDRVVVTAPTPRAVEMCSGMAPEELEAHRGVEYVGIVCASLVLKRPLTPYYVTNITEAWVPFTAVIEMSALVAPDQIGGRGLLYLPRYASPGDPIFSRSDAEIEELFVSALRRMHPELSLDDVLAFRVSRARSVFALSTLGYSDALPPMTTSVPGLHIVNSAQIVNGTLNVDETVQLAERALPELLGPVGA